MKRWALIIAALAVLAILGMSVTPAPSCAQGECSCPTVTAQAATVEHLSTVVVRVQMGLMGCSATLGAVRAELTAVAEPDSVLPYAGR